MESATDWHLILGRDGTVIGATDGAPESWIGARIEDSADAPEELIEACRTLLCTPHHAAAAVATTAPLESGARVVHLTVIDAMPVRRGPTDMRSLLRSTLEVLRRQARSTDKLASLLAPKADHPPTGLGLLLVRDIVTAHSGDLDIQSDAASFQRGTTVQITLPV